MAPEQKKPRLSAREGALILRLTAKEMELSEVQSFAADLCQAKTAVIDFTKQMYTDPAINAEFLLMRTQLAELEKKLTLAEEQAALAKDAEEIKKLQQRVQDLEALNAKLTSNSQTQEGDKAATQVALAEQYVADVNTLLTEANERAVKLEEANEVVTARCRDLERRLADLLGSAVNIKSKKEE